MPNSVQFFSSWATWLAAIGSRMGSERSRGRNAVVRGRDGEIGTADLEAALAQAVKGLRRSDFVHQVQIDVDKSVGAPASSWTTCASQTFSMIVCGMICFRMRLHTNCFCLLVPWWPALPAGCKIRRHAAAVEYLFHGAIHRGGFFRQVRSCIRACAATEPMAPNGLALFWPAISGAEPCTGSYSPSTRRRVAWRRWKPRAACRSSRPAPRLRRSEYRRTYFPSARRRSAADSAQAAWRSCRPAGDRARRRG